MESDVRYHILYWEGESPHGIFLETKEFTAHTTGKDGPGRCFCCNHMADTWRHRLDNMQISLRMCADPNDLHFRQDVEGFHCLSPKMGISYHLRQFDQYLWAVDKKSLTEDHVIGTALAVLKKQLNPVTCGVTVSNWQLQGSSWEKWLEAKVQELRKKAQAGRSGWKPRCKSFARKLKQGVESA